MAATEHEIERMVVRLVGDASEYKDTLEETIKATEDFVQETESISDDAGIYSLQEDYYKLSEELDQTTKRLQIFTGAQQELDDALAAGHISQEEFNQGQDALNAVINESNAILAAIRKPADDYANAVDVLNRHLQQGLLSQEEFNEASSNLAQGSIYARDALASMRDESEDLELVIPTLVNETSEYEAELRHLARTLGQTNTLNRLQSLYHMTGARELVNFITTLGHAGPALENYRREHALLARAMAEGYSTVRAREINHFFAAAEVGVRVASAAAVVGVGAVAVAGLAAVPVIYNLTRAVASFTAESIKLAATSSQHKDLIKSFEALNDEVTSLKLDVGNEILANFDLKGLADDAADFVNELRNAAGVVGPLAADAQILVDDLREMGIGAASFAEGIGFAADQVHTLAMGIKVLELKMLGLQAVNAGFWDMFGLTGEGVIEDIQKKIIETSMEIADMAQNKPSDAVGGGRNENAAATERERVELGRLVQGYEKQLATLGMTEAEKRRYELSTISLTDAEKKEALILLYKIELREKYLKQQEEMKKKTEELAKAYMDTFLNAMNEGAKASQKLAEDGKEMQKSLEDEITALQLEAIGIENVSDEMALLELIKRGASEATIENIQALMREKEALEEQAKLQKDAKKVIEELQTPMEEYRKERDRINKMNQQNLLTDEQATKALNNLQEEFMKGADAADYMDASVQALYASLQDNTAVTRGSKELRELQMAMLEDQTIRGAADKLNHEGETSPLLAFDAPRTAPAPQQGLLVDAKLTLLANFLKAIETNTKKSAEQEPAEFEVASF